MKKTFRLEGLDCANCASKIETAISKVNGVENASINFMTTKLILEVQDERVESIIENVKTVIKKIEPEIIIKKA